MHPTVPGLLALALAASIAPAAVQTAPASAPQMREADHRSPPAQFIAQYDTDADGAVPFAGFEAFRRARYAETDENGDGTVDVEEYANEYAGRLDREIETARRGHISQAHTRIKALDTDGDGVISRAEYDASGERAYAHYLKSADAAETPASRAGSLRDPIGMPTTHSRAGMLAMYDADGDGTVSRAEFDRARAEAFARTDRNGDGRLSGEEYLAEYEDRLDRQIASRRDGAVEQARVRFGALDTDKDGRVSWDEYAASGKRIFERADLDGNGTVDAADVAKAAAARPAHAARSAD
ncbi:EF-hand domain-containing protein [Xanthomonas sp. XNM01]|uniref:EF-hand domain-containing protein n=1 Tax=Xanthomonas sp. XNM01 TaxID=2769289 RepID=UPI001CE0606A|nr:EF-hand domain-containing protein [Xanthomonas sp. XNM01]